MYYIFDTTFMYNSLEINIVCILHIIIVQYICTYISHSICIYIPHYSTYIYIHNGMYAIHIKNDIRSFCNENDDDDNNKFKKKSLQTFIKKC